MFPWGTQQVHQSADSSRASENIDAVFDRDVFAQAMTAVSAALSDNEVDWVQLHFLGEQKVRISTGSHNLSIQFDFLGNYSGSGIIKVNGRQLMDYVKQLPSEKLRITATFPSQLTLKCGRSSARMQLVQDQTVSQMFEPEAGTQVLVKGEALERWVNTFKEFVATDDTRFYANGALIWGQQRSLGLVPDDGMQERNNETDGDCTALFAVASDAQRLAKSRLLDEIQFEKIDGSKVLVPKKALEELKRVCGQNQGKEILLKWSQESQFFSVHTADYLMISKCIAGNYPPYAAAIPSEIRTKVTVPSRALLESVRRVMLFADKNRIIKLNFDGHVLDVQSSTPGQRAGEDIIELSSSVSKPFEVNYNGNLLTGVLSVLHSGELEFGWEDVNRPVKIIGDQEKSLDVFYLLVPTRF